MERIGRPDFQFRDPEMAQTFANFENMRNILRQPQQGNNQRRRGRRQQSDDDFQDAVNALASMRIDDRQPYDPEDRARILESTTRPQYHSMELDPQWDPQRQVLDRTRQGIDPPRPPRVSVRRGQPQQTLQPQQQLPPLGYEPVGRDYVNEFIQYIGGVPTPENPYIFYDGRRLIGFREEGFAGLYRPVYQYDGGKRKTRRNRTRGRGRGRPYGSTRGSKKKKTIKKRKSHNTTKKNKKVNKKGRNVKISEQNNKI